MVFQFRIDIKNISSPPVWRRLKVPSQWTFDLFHQAIQASFGWDNHHLYMFSPKGWGSEPCIGSPLWNDSDCRNGEKVRLRDFFRNAKEKIVYIYDFGDDWIHNILLEKIIEENRINPELIDGRGKCPPEDCGGSFAYMDLKDILKNPEYPEYNEIREWFGLSMEELWDPAEINLQELKQALHEVR